MTVGVLGGGGGGGGGGLSLLRENDCFQVLRVGV